MGIFNSLLNMPGKGVTMDELHRVFKTLHARHSGFASGSIPQDLYDLWEMAAKPYINEHDYRYSVMDAKEVEKYIEDVEELTKHSHPQYVGYIPELKMELEKAVEGTYGNISGL